MPSDSNDPALVHASMITGSKTSEHHWLAERISSFDNSGIRKVFDLASKLKDPVNLSIGQPDFDVPQLVKDACIEAIQTGKNAYALSQGMPVLREKLQAQTDEEYGHADREVFVASGTSGALLLAMMAMIDPGDEVIMFDPYFVMYSAHVAMMGGRSVKIDTAPSFRIDLDQVRDAITDKTKMILLNSPGNPTGVVASEQEMRGLAEIAAEKDVLLVSDEIYRHFCYDEPFRSPAVDNDRTLVIDGFSKSHAMTGWRLGFAHGPREVIQAMIKIQQYTFVCAPQPAQWAGAVAMDVDMSQHVAAYRKKRDMLYDALKDDYEIVKPGGAFYMFPKAPNGKGSEFVARAIENSLLIIPGKIFSMHDTHFRISFAAADETLERGIELLLKLAK